MNRLVLLLAAILGVGCTRYFIPLNPDAGIPGTTDPSATPSNCDLLSECGAVIEPATPPPAITGGNLAAMEDGTWVIADPDRSMLWHVNTTRVLGKVELAPSDFPGRVLAHGGKAFVILRRAAQLAELDLATHDLVRRDTCVEPRGLALRGEEILVGCAGGEIEAFSALGGRRTFLQSKLLEDLRDVEVEADRLVVSTFRNAQFFEVREGVEPRVLNNAPKSAAVGSRVVPRVAWRLRAGLIVAQDELTDRPPAPEYYSGPTTLGPGLVSTALYRVEGQKVIALGNSKAVLPVDVVSAGGSIFVASAATNDLYREVFANGEEYRFSLPGQPTSLAISGGTLAVFLREPAQVMFYSLEGELQSTLPLDAGSAFSTSHELFHRAGTAALACASCHPEAGDDGHTWMIDGPRRTPSLRGGVSTTAPFHWTGQETDMRVLMTDVLVTRMRGKPQSPQRIQAFTKWLDAQEALRPPSVDVAAAARGKELFDSTAVGCASCHSGAQGTNNANANVGTDGTFQVPRLLELAWRAPYFHDGRVESLEARFLPVAGGALHGNVEQLDAQQRADLLEYLKSR